MTLLLSDVDRIARLARLELQADEVDVLYDQLNSFFAIVEKMSSVNTQGIEPLYTPLSAVGDVALPLRADEVTETTDIAQRTLNQVSAPSVQMGLYMVPKVIE